MIYFDDIGRVKISGEVARAMIPSPEVARAMIASHEAVRAMIPSPEVVRAMIASHEAVRAMIPSPEVARAMASSFEALGSIRHFSKYKKKQEIKEKKPEIPKSDEIKSIEISFKIEIKEPTEEQNSYFSYLGETKKEQLLFIEKVIKDMGVCYVGDGDKKAIYEECDKKRPNFLGGWRSFCNTWIDLNKSGRGVPTLGDFEKSVRVHSK